MQDMETMQAVEAMEAEEAAAKVAEASINQHKYLADECIAEDLDKLYCITNSRRLDHCNG